MTTFADLSRTKPDDTLTDTVGHRLDYATRRALQMIAHPAGKGTTLRRPAPSRDPRTGRFIKRQ